MKPKKRKKCGGPANPGLPPLPPEVEAKLAKDLERIKAEHGFADGSLIRQMDKVGRNNKEYQEARRDPAKWRVYCERHFIRPAMAEFDRTVFKPLMSAVKELQKKNREAPMDKETRIAEMKRVLETYCPGIKLE